MPGQLYPGEHAQPIDAQQIQQRLEQWIRADLPRHVRVDNQQRAVQFGDLPSYPCGGTHVSSLATLGAVNVISVNLKKGVLSVRYDLN